MGMSCRSTVRSCAQHPFTLNRMSMLSKDRTLQGDSYAEKNSFRSGRFRSRFPGASKPGVFAWTSRRSVASFLCRPGEFPLPAGGTFHLSGEPQQWKKAQENQAQSILDRAADLLSKLGFTRTRIETELGSKSANAAQGILAASERQPPDAIALARKGQSAVKRFFLGSTTAMVCQYAENLPVWVVGKAPLTPPRLLAAVDESPYAERVVVHIGESFGKLPGAPSDVVSRDIGQAAGYWDDGHILDETNAPSANGWYRTGAQPMKEYRGPFSEGQSLPDRRGHAGKGHYCQAPDHGRGYRPGYSG